MRTSVSCFWPFILTVTLPPLNFRNPAPESLEHRPDDGVLLKPGAQFRSAGVGARRCAHPLRRLQSNTDTQGLAYHFAGDGAQFLHRVTRLQQIGERAAVGWKI